MEVVKSVHKEAVRSRSYSSLWSRMVKVKQLYLLMLLPFLYLIVFKYYPIYGAQIAFKNFNAAKGFAGSPWVGFDLFVQFFQSYEFFRIIWNTVALSFYHLIAGFPLAIILALSLNYVQNQRLKKAVQMITYAPHFISVVVIVGILVEFLDPRSGLFNHILGLFGVHPVNFLGEPKYFQHIYVWSGIWQNVGFSCIIYLAALSGVDLSLHEAATVDGATKLQRMWYIDLPGIMPMAMIILIMQMGSILDTGFEKVLLLQNPLNLETSEVIDTYVYKVGLTSAIPDYSYSTAIGLFKSVLSAVMVIVVNQLAKKFGKTSLW